MSGLFPSEDHDLELAAPVQDLSTKWKLIPLYLRAQPLIRHHIASFNYFVDKELRQIVRWNGYVTSEASSNWFLKYLDIRVGTPSVFEHVDVQRPLTPHQCRISDLTYAAPLLVDIEHYRCGQRETVTNVFIGYLPIMLRSSRCCLLQAQSDAELAERFRECPLDPGGYFIVRGAERVILIQEQLCKNRMLVELDARGDLCATVTSSTAERKSRTAVVYRGERLYLRHNTLTEDIPIVIVFRAMGIHSAAEVVALISWHAPLLEPSLEQAEALGIESASEALRYIGQRLRALAQASPWRRQDSSTASQGRRRYGLEEEARALLRAVVLPHTSCEGDDLRDKVLYIALMIRGVLAAKANPDSLDDKDYYGNKRLELAGPLLALLFEDLFKKFNADIRRHADQVLAKPSRTQDFDVTRCMRSETISHGFEHALSSGNWALKRFRMERQGVTQVLSRLSYVAVIGMMSRITSQFEKTRKISGPRALQPSQWGMLCPCDTPEGESCGLVKNLALLANVTTEENDAVLRRLLYDLGTQEIRALIEYDLACWERAGKRDSNGAPKSSTAMDTRPALVFVNGLLLGMHLQPSELAAQLRAHRRRAALGAFVSIWESSTPAWRALHVATDAGRVCRPLLLVDAKQGTLLLQRHHLEDMQLGILCWEDLLKQGIIEYLDPNEENDALIALDERQLQHRAECDPQNNEKLVYTHVEISPESILGACAGLIPYANHNQSPRNTYQCAMSKQAIGAMAYNQHLRTDALLYLLNYPQRPLVQTHAVEFTHYAALPGGQNAIVAVMSYSGYDIEDALIVNRASVDRGFGRCTVLRKYPVSLRAYPNGTRDTIEPLASSTTLAGATTTSTASATAGIQSDPGGRPNHRHSPEEGPKSATSSMDTEIAAERRRRVAEQALDTDGIAAPGMPLPLGGILVNKYTPLETLQAPLFGLVPDGPAGHASPREVAATSIPDGRRIGKRPALATYRAPGGAGVVDQVLITQDQNDLRLVKVMVRQTRRVVEGDKYASRFGQKGVVGLIPVEVDLPWHGESGIRPDIVFNPHGMPSRMTVGKVFELIAGKAAALDGRFRDATAFVERCGLDSTAASAEALLRLGFAYSGRDVLYSGISGEPLAAHVFCGPIYYQRLKHMAVDKCFGRARGPRAVLTRQPTEGRSRDGGLRLGEMERDSLLGHGASLLVLERLMYSSDAFAAFVCEACGQLGTRDWCQFCRKGNAMQRVLLPYACKLLFQELQSMNIVTKLRLAEIR
jgi:DNA-directed RNA polymerase III subunit RPC2